MSGDSLLPRFVDTHCASATDGYFSRASNFEPVFRQASELAGIVPRPICFHKSIGSGY